MTDMTEMTNQTDPSPNQPETVGGSALSPAELERITDDIIAALKTVYDPEIPVDIYELGLIYGLDVDPLGNHADIQMTLTAPGCPVAGSMPEWVENAVRHTAGVESVNVELVWEPPWTPERMSMRAKLELNMV